MHIQSAQRDSCVQAEGAASLSAGLLASKSLQQLSLGWNGLYDEGCYPLADVISNNVSLQVGALSQCLQPLTPFPY